MRVLLVRLDGVGDAAVCTPLIAALRSAGHEVGVALTTRNAGLFSPDAIVAEHVLERIPWPAHGSTPASTARARAEIARLRYDAALIASEEPEAYALAARIPRRVGFTTGWTRPLKTLWVRLRTTRTIARTQRVGGEDAHEAEILYRLGSGLVGEPAPPVDLARLRGVLLGSRAERSPGRGVVFQAGPKWVGCGVPEATLRRLIAALSPAGLRVLAAPGEVDHVRATFGLAPETFGNLRDWVEALAGAAVVVTVDTGAAHVAGMLGVPVVDVFPNAHFAAQLRRWRPWASPYRAIPAATLVNGTGTAIIEAVRDGF